MDSGRAPSRGEAFGFGVIRRRACWDDGEGYGGWGFGGFLKGLAPVTPLAVVVLRGFCSSWGLLGLENAEGRALVEPALAVFRDAPEPLRDQKV